MSKIDFDLYLIADMGEESESLVSSVKKAIDGGVRGVQLRGKKIPPRKLLDVGEKLRKLTAERSVKFFVNDRIDIALALEADGVHLGQSSLPVSCVRRIAGNRFLIGVSTHSLEEARSAEKSGADFITFGPIFATSSKLAYGPPVGVKRLEHVTSEISIPVFAIGGIKTDSVKSVIEKRAYGVAVISAILNSDSIFDAASKMLHEIASRKCESPSPDIQRG